jgi:ABC-type lipoprotein release transport system permease subunit
MEPGAILGSWLAEDYGLEVGDYITVATHTRSNEGEDRGTSTTIDAEIVGIIFTPNPVINRYGLYLDIELVQAYMNMEARATSIHVNLDGKDRAELDSWAEENGLVFNGWEMLAEDFLAMADMKSAGTASIIGLLILIAAIGITNTMIMAIYERTREIGTLRAMGMKDSQILWMFTWEGAGIGVLGALLGLTGAFLMNIYLVIFGIDYSFILRQMDAGYRVATIMRGDWVLEYFAIGFVVSIVISGFIAYLTSLRAVRKTIPEALQTN